MSSSEPTPDFTCSSCSAFLESEFNYCPFCGHRARLVCQACHAPLQDNWTWCPTCGQRSGPEPVSIPTMIIPGAGDATPAQVVNSAAEDFNRRAVELYEAERYEEAIEEFHKALAMDPANSVYHCNLAVAYGEQGDAAKAFDEYQRALALNPTDLTALLNLGYTYHEQGQNDQAQNEWQKLIEVAPNSPEAEEARDNLRTIEVE
ncbi:MAG: tetratricopeptide repeat protein [Armatimonadota bacterium]|nr:tetratricopeptide repeat protein [Armatimonadota bacterium]